MTDFQIDLDGCVDFLVELLNTPSPTGYTSEAVSYCERAFNALGAPGLRMTRTRKGALLMQWNGESRAQVGVTAHLDTLGLMVKEIKPNGALKTTRIGGIIYNGIECENVTVRTFDDRRYRGTVLLNEPAAHVNRDVHTAVRDENSMEVRLDEKTSSAAGTRALGIEVGDFIFVDPRVEVVPSGFVRSRFLDDKASVACIYAAAAALAKAGAKPANDTTILLSNYEEVGHGGASDWSPDLDEYLCVDMAAIGGGQSSTEFDCTICVKDASGTYSYEMIRKLRELCSAHAIPYRTDIYPFYSSDGSAYWSAGGAARVGLIGPGVSGSHAYERTHRDALAATTQLIARYLLAAV
jgi:putative aminopeptidase FrvX